MSLLTRGTSSGTRKQRLLARMAHPRIASVGNQLTIGYLMDWIDSRPEERYQNLAALSSLGKGRTREAHIARVAEVLMGAALPPPEFAALAFGRDFTHDQIYQSGDGVYYHDRIVGQLEEDELEEGGETYRALLRLEPTCLSALANLSEYARRRGQNEGAVTLARQALDIAERSAGGRYGVADSAWQRSLRCLLARLTKPRTATVIEILNRATGEHAKELIATLTSAEDREQAVVDIHAAFALADGEARLWLRVAMDHLSFCPQPSFSYGGSAEYRAFLERRGAFWRAMEEELASGTPVPQ